VTSERVELAGGRQATYEVIGEGRPSLMFAGGPGLAAEYMRGDAELFAPDLKSYLIDPHGSGGSSPPATTADYSPEGHARFYEEVRQALGLDRVAVFGHSFGATTALTYSALFPTSVDACIAVAAYGIGVDLDAAEGGEAASDMEAMAARHEGAPWYPEAKKLWDEWTDRVLATDDPHEVEYMLKTVMPMYTAHPDRPEVWDGLEEFRSHIVVDLAADKAWESGLFQGVDLRPYLGKIEAPVLIVAGELDLVCGPAQAHPIADGVTGSTLVLIPDCGHLPVIEATDAYRKAVEGWLEERD
jgi:proline iminopeptidase